MPISNRPNLEDFINKGGSSTISPPAPEEKKPVQKNARTAKAQSRPKQGPVPSPAPSPLAKTIGRPRKVKQPNEVDSLKFVMRIPAQISEELNQVVEGRKIPISRNAWILEAIVERMERERNS